MCGIIGVFGSQAETKVMKGLKIMQARGKDAKGTMKVENGAVGHCLHAMIGNIPQPLKGKGTLAANCEIYNWMELGHGKNDADILLQMLDDEGCTEEVLEMLDGVYAFAYIRGKKVWLARDYFGVKPLFYATKPSFAFASEKKALEELGFTDAKALHPRQILEYDREITLKQKKEPETKEGDVWQAFESAVKKRIPSTKFGLMLSGAKSTAIAKVLKDSNEDFTCYTVGIKGSKDIERAKQTAKELNLKHTIIELDKEKIMPLMKQACRTAETSHPQESENGAIIYAASEAAAKDKCKALFSGTGGDEILGSYERMREGDAKKEKISALRRMFDTVLYSQDAISMHNGIEIRLPFLDKEVIAASLDKTDRQKFIDSAVKKGIPEKLLKERQAPQYGSGIHKMLKGENEALKKYYSKPNLKLAALCSGGKDSIHALQIMKEMNYEISCIVTIISKNKDSYMYHTPATNIVKLQAKAMKIPLIEQKSKGEKEKELEELKKAMEIAIKKYEIEGTVSGALFSSYQRDRIEKVCEELGLVMFAPLWHKEQERELKETIKKGYKIIMTRVAADGLNKEWLGKVITIKDIEKLKKTKGINIAGEGGEYETLVLECPLFSKKIRITKSTIKDNTLEIQKAGLAGI